MQLGNLVNQSIPASYVALDVKSTDGVAHSIQVYTDITAGELISRYVYAHDLTFNRRMGLRRSYSERHLVHQHERSQYNLPFNFCSEPKPISRDKSTSRLGQCLLRGLEFCQYDIQNGRRCCDSGSIRSKRDSRQHARYSLSCHHRVRVRLYATS